MALRALLWAWGLAIPATAAEPTRQHLWPNVRGHSGRYGISDVKVPRNFSNGVNTWRWQHRNGQYGTTVVGGPVIDYDSNLYIVEMTGVHKFSPDGKEIWMTSPIHLPNRGCFFPDGPSLMGEYIFVTTQCGQLCCLDIATGSYQWGGSCRQYFPSTGGDSKYVSAHDGVVIIGTDDAGAGGSKHVVAVNATDGSKLWQFAPDVPTWNNMGMFPGDDTVIFQDWDGRAYRLGLHNGSLIWKNGGNSFERYPHHPYSQTWTDGGLLLGADGVAYAVSSFGDQTKSSMAFVGGGIHAHRLSDGHLLWERRVDHPVLTWPVIAKHPGDKSHTVYVFPSAGAFRNCQVWETSWAGIEPHLWKGWEDTLENYCVTAAALMIGWAALQCKCPRLLRLVLAVALGAALACAQKGYEAYKIYSAYRDWYYGGDQPSDMVVLDADTGNVKYKHTIARWKEPTAKGDQAGWIQKSTTQPWRGMCCPVAYSSPSVDGNGVVYIGHMSGFIFGVKDWDGNGAISEDEVYKFDAESAFLHSGPAFAPGIFAFTTCDQLFVWRF